MGDAAVAGRVPQATAVGAKVEAGSRSPPRRWASHGPSARRRAGGGDGARPGALRKRKDFLSVVLAARESNKSSRELLTSDYISMLTYEHPLIRSATTSFTISPVVYLIAKHPEVEDKLLRAIDGCLHLSAPPPTTTDRSDGCFALQTY